MTHMHRQWPVDEYVVRNGSCIYLGDCHSAAFSTSEILGEVDNGGWERQCPRSRFHGSAHHSPVMIPLRITRVDPTQLKVGSLVVNSHAPGLLGSYTTSYCRYPFAQMELVHL